MDNKYKVKLKDSPRVTEVLATCAFAFAFISFLSTANGLNEFAFEDSPWRGYFLSFGIEGVLIVLNLTLPKFFKQKLKGKIGWKVIFVLFYIVLLVASAFFSFVFISNLSYDKTYYINTQAVAEDVTSKAIKKAQDYVSKKEQETSKLIKDEVSKLRKNEAIPLFVNLLDAYSPKELLEPVSSVVPKENQDKVSINNPAIWNDNRIKARHEELREIRENLKNTYKRLDKVSTEIQAIMKNPRNEYEKELINAAGSVERIYKEIVDYQNKVKEIDSKIEAINDNINDPKTSGWEKDILNIEKIYYGRQKSEYDYWITLIEDPDTKKKGEVAQWNESLNQLRNRESVNILTLFDNIRIALSNNGLESEEYEAAYDEMIEELNILVQNQDTENETWSYQDFIEKYEEFEKFYKLNIELKSEIINVEIAEELTDEELEDAKNADENKNKSEREIRKLALKEKNEDWLSNWNENIKNLHGKILEIPDGSDYSSAEESAKLINLYRNHFSELSNVERALIQLRGPYYKNAVFAFIFAFFLDLSSLAVGILISLREDNSTAIPS